MNSDFEELLSLFNANAGKLSGGPLCQRVVQESARAIFLENQLGGLLENSKGGPGYSGRTNAAIRVDRQSSAAD